MSSTTTFLQPEELVDLTDRQLPSKQIDWLNKYGWKFAISAAGKPKVARSYYEFRLGNMETEPAHEQEPDFSYWTTANGGAQKKQPRAGHGPAVRLRG